MDERWDGVGFARLGDVIRRCQLALVVTAVLAAGGCSAGDAEGPIPSSEITGPATPPTSPPTEVTEPPVPTTPSAVNALGEARLTVTPDAAGFAARFSAAHATISDPAAPVDQVTVAGQQLQLLLRALADVPELDEAVLDALDPAARPSIERIVRARQFLQARNAADTTPSEPPTELPAWTIVEPEPVDVLLAHYAEAEALAGIPWYWLAAIHLQETRMGRIQGVSSAGAVGPMQFLPTTWAECCTGDPSVTRDAIIGAATYLAQSGGPADMNAAVYQYNPNDGYVAVVTAYAETLRDEPGLYRGLHAFQVFFGSAAGTVRLPIGYSQSAPVDAAAYLAANPADAA
jgi:hypothetical protein